MDEIDKLFDIPIDITFSGEKGSKGDAGKTPKIGAGIGAPNDNQCQLYLDTESGDVWLNS